MARYHLRSTVQLQTTADGRVVLSDRTLRRAVRLGDTDARIVRALGGGATAAQIARKTGLGPDEVARRLTGLARLYVLQGRRSQARIALEAERSAFADQSARSAHDDAIEWPPGREPPRHACLGTGTCCGASFLGPLTDADAGRLVGLGVLDGDPEALFEQVELGGRVHTGMRRRDDSGTCVVQRPDRLCGVHAEHGAAAKPVACRQFPLRLHRSPRGVHVSLLLACDGYDRAREAAGAWADRADEIRGLLAEGAVAVRVTLPFELAAGVPVPAEAWWRLRDDCFGLEPAGGADAAGWLAAVLERAGDALRAREAELAEGPEIRWADGLDRLAAAVRAPGQLYDPASARVHAGQLRARAEALAERQLTADAGRLRDLADGLEAQLEGLHVRPGGPLSATDAARRHLADVVANDLALYVAIGHLDAGLGNLTRRLLAAEALACRLATRAGRTEVDGRDTTRALHVVYRCEPDLTQLAAVQRP